MANELRHVTESEEKKILRSRNFSIVTYLDKEVIRAIFLEHNCMWCSFITHDCDVDNEGITKAPHTHIVLVTREAKTESAVKKWFSGYADEDGVEINTFVEIAHDVNGALRYLIHLDDSKKFQYNPSLVESWGDTSHFNNAIAKVDVQFDTATQCVMDMLAGATIRSLVLKYGRDFIYHYNQIHDVAMLILSEENAMFKEENEKKDEV